MKALQGVTLELLGYTLLPSRIMEIKDAVSLGGPVVFLISQLEPD